MPFQKGRKKTGGKKPGSVNTKGTLQDHILGALDALGGQAYLEMLGRKHPSLLVALLGRVLPMTVVGDKNNPIHHLYEVSLGFGQRTETHQGEHGVSDAVSGPAADIKALVHMRSP